jgi:predicted DNA-binding protein
VVRMRSEEKVYKLKTFSLDVSIIQKLEELRKRTGKTATAIVEEAIDQLYKQLVLNEVVAIDLSADKELQNTLKFYQSLYFREFNEFVDINEATYKLLNRLLLLEIAGVEREITLETINYFRKLLGLEEIEDVSVISKNSRKEDLKMDMKRIEEKEEFVEFNFESRNT